MEKEFTKQAERVLQLARAFARKFHHPYVGTEHLLLALREEFTGVAGQVLAMNGVKNEEVENVIRELASTTKEIKNIKDGQTFIQGELIMKDGNVGKSTGRHLHMELSLFNEKEDINLTKNRCDPTNYMMLKDDVKIKNDYYKRQKKHYVFKQ